MSTTLSTTIRVSDLTKKKMDVLKKGMSYEKYIQKLNEFVEKDNLDLETSVDNLPKLIKDRSSAIIKILRAYEKQYFIPTKTFSENNLELTAEALVSKTEEDIVTEEQKEIPLKKEIQIEEKIVFQTDETKKKELLFLLNDIKEKSVEEEDKVVYNSFYIYQKLDMLSQKISKL